MVRLGRTRWLRILMGQYSDVPVEHVMAPRNRGVMENPDLTGHAGAPAHGASLILFLKVCDDRVIAAKYQTHGCGPTIASRSMLTEPIVGRTIAECREPTADDPIAAPDGVPPEKLHRPALAIAALKDALRERRPPTGSETGYLSADDADGRR